MSYLARLKQLESGEIFHHTPKPEPTKPTKGASDGFVGSIPGAYENIHAENDANETRNQEEHWRWLVHFSDREPVEVYCDPDETHAGILKCYPDALGAEPIPERIKRMPTESETTELTRLVRLCGERYDFTEAEHAEALAIALADPSDALTCFRGMAFVARDCRDVFCELDKRK